MDLSHLTPSENLNVDRNELSGSIKDVGFFWQAKLLLASQDGLCSMELVCVCIKKPLRYLPSHNNILIYYLSSWLECSEEYLAILFYSTIANFMAWLNS
jgi:hypothetical protein